MSERIGDIEKYEKRLKEKGDVGNFVIGLVNLTGREVDELPSEIEFERALSVIEGIWQNLNKIDITSIKRGDDEPHEVLQEFLNQALVALGYEAIDNNFYNIVIKQCVVNDFYKNFAETGLYKIALSLLKNFCLWRYFTHKSAIQKGGWLLDCLCVRKVYMWLLY